MAKKYTKKAPPKISSYSYRPTKAEKKLLEVLINPENAGCTVAELCRLADISKARYYRIVRKKEYMELVNQMTKDLIGDRIYDVLNSTYVYSLDSKGHNDRKLLLQMYGLFAEKTEVNLSGSVETNIKSLSEEELALKVQELEELLGIGE